MASIYSMSLWLINLSLLSELQPVISVENSSETANYADVLLMLEYRKFIDSNLRTKNCTMDYHFSDSQPFVLDYQTWEKEEDLTNNVANFLTSAWRHKNDENYSLVENEATMYSLVRSNALSLHGIYGSVICFEGHRFRGRERFCPYAFKDKTARNRTRVFDLGAQYNYVGNPGHFVWWKVGREKGLKNKPKTAIEYYDVNLMNVNASIKSGKFFNVSRRFVTSDDGIWTNPYYDCFGGKTWMLTYLAPFYNENDIFLGVVSIDIELDTIEINQCDFPKTEAVQEAKRKWTKGKIQRPLSFYGTHLCKNQSTECVHIPDTGFTAGNYLCVCRKGYYFPDHKADTKSFDGRKILDTYTNNWTLYRSMFECFPCREGCEQCVDDTPCMYSRNIPMRTVFLALNETIKALAVALAIFIFVFREHKIIKASSPVFMEIIVLGIILMYFEISLGYLEASVAVCVAQSWLSHVGFMLAFGSLLLKTWRVAVIFRLRSAKMIELTDGYLMKYLAIMVAAVMVYLMIWTWTSTQAYEVNITSSGYKYRRCVRHWFSNAMGIGEVLFLSWGVLLCLRVRNAPSAYNESKYIAWCIYNTVFIMVLVGLLRIVLDNFHNPDVSYVVDFLSTHVVATIMLMLLFVSKIFFLRKYTTESAKARSNSSTSTCVTDLRKSPFHLNRLVNGSWVPEIEEERTVYSLEAENIALREEIRSLTAHLAVYENKTARQDRRKECGPPADGNNQSRNNSDSLPQNNSRDKKGHTTSLGQLSAVSAEHTGRERNRSTLSGSVSDTSVFIAEENHGSLIENIKNSGKTTNNNATHLTLPLKMSVSNESIILNAAAENEMAVIS